MNRAVENNERFVGSAVEYRSCDQEGSGLYSDGVTAAGLAGESQERH